MKRLFFVLLFVLSFSFLHADEGMWLFDVAPKQQIKEKYGFDLTDDWLAHVQKSTCRFARSGTASFVSSQGLILTNHHVGSRTIHSLSTAENNLLENGFYAKTFADEIKCPGLEILVTMLSEDVTARVNAGITGGLAPEEAQKIRNANIAALEKEYTEKTGLRCEVITLFQGGKYYLYGYKVYTDVRLVWAPEESIGSFGGDPDNYEFPRYCVDAALFRAYENDKPAKIEHFLRWNYDGVKEGELVFVSGFPGRTERSYTREHLEFQRDVFFPWRLQKLFRREVNYSIFASTSAENQRRISDDLGAVQNYRKRAMGQLAGLQTPSLWGDDIPSAEEKGSPALEILKALVAARKDNLYIAYDLLELGEAFNSQTFRIARNLVRLATELEKPSVERLPEFRDDKLESLKTSILSPAPIHEDAEILKLTDSLSMLFESATLFHPAEIAVQVGLSQPSLRDQLLFITHNSLYNYDRQASPRSPRELAVELIRNSKVRSIEERKRLIDGGIAAIRASDDPMVKFALSVDISARKFRKEYEEKVEAPMTAAYAELAKQRFEKFGTSVYPDATFTLRLSYGAVKGYKDDNVNDIAPFTTIAGLFERAELQKFKEPFDPAQSWKDAKSTLDMTVPFNLVTTNDIVGGNSGSPLINTKKEIVGLAFDGNAYSLSNNFVYTDTQGRCVNVHAAVIVEALKKINKDTRILAELGQ